MGDLISLADNAALQCFVYAVGVLGITISFRIARYPDLTADGSFILGSTVFAIGTTAVHSWELPLVWAVAAGMLAGLTTSLLHSAIGVSRLLTGILTAMIAYSLSFRILGTSNQGLRDPTMFTAAQSWDQTVVPVFGIHLGQLAVGAAFAIITIALVWYLLRSELGLFLRGSGANAKLIEELGRSAASYQAISLAAANGLVAMSGALVTAQQGFSDVNMGVGVLITFVAALVIGEEIVGRFSRNDLVTRVIAPFVGVFLYFLLYLFLLRASIRGWIPVNIQPTDLKMLSALVVVAVIALRANRGRREETLPL